MREDLYDLCIAAIEDGEGLSGEECGTRHRIGYTLLHA